MMLYTIQGKKFAEKVCLVAFAQKDEIQSIDIFSFAFSMAAKKSSMQSPCKWENSPPRKQKFKGIVFVERRFFWLKNVKTSILGTIMQNLYIFASKHGFIIFLHLSGDTDYFGAFCSVFVTSID